MVKKYSILGCGWLGLPLAKSFIENGVEVKGTTTSTEKIKLLQEEKIHPYLINIEETTDYKDFLDSDVLLIMITSKKLEAFQKLIQQIENSRVKKVIFISSTSVYPRNNKTYTEEDETIDALLSNVERLFRDNTNFTTTIIRFAGLFGGNRQPGNWFADRKIPQPKGFVNMIHREDCIAILSEIIEKDIFGETFNACVNHHPTREDFYKHAREILGKPMPTFDTLDELKFKKISSAKLINKLNYTFIHDNLLNMKR